MTRLLYEVMLSSRIFAVQGRDVPNVGNVAENRMEILSDCLYGNSASERSDT